jgi:CBS domain-containing protein
VNHTIVKDLMVPLSEYATVPDGSTLYDAVLALEKAQEKFDLNRYHHRAVLILNRENRVIGKLSQLDVLRALETRNEAIDQFLDISRYGFSPTFINRLRERHRMAGEIVENIDRKAASLKVQDFMQAPSEGEYVEESTSLDTAIHQLVAGTHLSLLVTRGDEIVGILRMSDVFSAVFHAIQERGRTE